MNIPVDPPRFSRPSQRVPLSLPQVPLAALSLPATQTLNQPVQRTRPPGLPTVRVHNPPVRPFRAHGTVRHPAASDAIGSRHPHAQALAREPSGPERASLRVSRPLQGENSRAGGGDIHTNSIEIICCHFIFAQARGPGHKPGGGQDHVLAVNS